MNKPISIIMTETKQSIISILNNSGLPPVILEPMMKEVFHLVQEAAQEELRKDTQEWEKAQEMASNESEPDNIDTESDE